jgi:hypothetical protein
LFLSFHGIHLDSEQTYLSILILQQDRRVCLVIDFMKENRMMSTLSGLRGNHFARGVDDE